MKRYLAVYRGPYNENYKETDKLYEIDISKHNLEGIYINLLECENLTINDKRIIIALLKREMKIYD